jgi:hypothetical protein
MNKKSKSDLNIKSSLGCEPLKKIRLLKHNPEKQKHSDEIQLFQVFSIPD